MPELPEVETVRRDLQHHLVGRTIADVHITWPRAIEPLGADTFAAALRGATIAAALRRGKYLGFQLSTGLVLVCHLKMTGRLLIALPGADRPRWVHNWFDLADGGALWFQDARKFGRMWLVTGIEEASGRLGPEPLEPHFTVEALRAAVARRSAPIKAVLLQQEVIAGVGNIYADEALWAARIHPLRPANSLTEAEVAALRGTLRQVIRRAVAHRGSSMDDFRDAFGREGFYRSHLKVYGRRGQACLRCGTTLVGEVIRQRSAVWCPTCQPEMPNAQERTRASS